MNNLQWLAEPKTDPRSRQLARWESAGRPVPVPAVVVQSLVRDYAERWGISTFIENATGIGEMVRSVGDRFDRVITIDWDSAMYSQAMRTFAEFPHVTCLRGGLPALLTDTKTRALIWLDGHKRDEDEILLESEVITSLWRSERHVLLIERTDSTNIAWLDQVSRDLGYTLHVGAGVVRLEPVINRPSFSVLMPTLNRGEFLTRAVEAVLGQRGVDLQLIVKNGGDAVALPVDARITYLHEPDAGIPDAMNQALARADGDVLTWANDDDIMGPAALDFVATWLDDAEWGYGRMRMVDGAGKDLGPAGGAAWDPVLNLRDNGIPQPSTYWRRRLGLQVGEFDIEVGAAADFDYWTRLGAIAEPKVTDRILATYTVHPDSFSVRSAGALAQSAARVRRKHGGAPIMADLGVDRLVLWGLRDEFRDLHHIMAAFLHAGERAGLEVVWVNDDPSGAEAVRPGSLTFAYDGACQHLPSVEGARYLLHNLGGDADLLARLPAASWVLYQVYTDDLMTADGPAWGCEQWDTYTYIQREGRALFQPWGTDRLPDEHLSPVWSGHADVVHWVGSVWDNELRQGNERTIAEMRAVLADHGLRFVQSPPVEPADGVALVRASRIAPAITGEWQAENGYLPCRYFKNISYGHLGVTNVGRLRDLMGDTFVEGKTIAEQISDVLEMSSADYLDRTREQQKLVAPYNYGRKLRDVARVFEECR